MGLGDAPALTVFIAEDHVAVREILVAYMRTRSHLTVVGQTADGLEVVDQCLRLRPKVLILDVDLPGMNGVSVARALSKSAPDIHMLAFTAHVDGPTIRQLLEAGVRGVVEKTSPADTLMEALDTVGAGRAYFGERVTKVLQHSFTDSIPTQSEDRLTSRERQVLQLIAEGFSNKEVSQKLGISVKTAENHRHHVMTKLGTRNAADLTREAFRLGMIRGLPPSPS